MPVSFDSILCLLKKCKKEANLATVRRAYCLLVRNGLTPEGVVGDSLIRLFAKCGSLQEANLVFSKIAKPSVYTWHAIITATSMLGHNDRALQLYYTMLKDSVEPNKFIFTSVLKACSCLGSLREGRLIYDMIARVGLDLNLVVQNALLDMYVKCESMEKACDVFNAIAHPDVVSWGVMISGYASQGHTHLAVESFKRMQQDGIEPNKVIFLGILKACGDMGSLELGQIIHSQIARNGLETDVIIGNTLICVYAKCGSLEEARKVFDQLTNQDIVSYSVMIDGYAQHEQGLLGIELFERMQMRAIRPNKFTFSCILKALSSVGAIGQGKLIHDQIIRSGLQSDIVIGSTLVDMYAKCGSLEDAHKVFESMPIQDAVSWGVMIGCYAQNGYGLPALELFEKMQLKGVKPDKLMLVCILKACGQVGVIERGNRVHDLIIQYGFESDMNVGNNLVGMYAKCQSVSDAHKVFDTLGNFDSLSVGIMISGYAEHGHGLLALELFQEMQQKGMKPNEVIFLLVLKACSSIGIVKQGRLLHDQMICCGILVDGNLGNTLVDMYFKCGSLDAAQKVFDGLQNRDEVSWGVMIVGYVQHGHCHAASELLEKMQLEGMKPNIVTLCGILKACAGVGALQLAKLVHNYILESGLDSDLGVGNSIIDMYAKCENMCEAYRVFEAFQNRDAVSWGAMISGYVQKGDNLSAVKLFEMMQYSGIKADRVILSCTLRAYGNIGAHGHVDLIHDQVVNSGLESDPVVGSALVDMYAKCGKLEAAHCVFEKLQNRDVVSWGSMIAALALYGHGCYALELFKKMQEEGIEPNKVTFLCTLKACGSVGAIKQGELLHQHIIKSELDSDLVIGNALVDMYCKSGCLKEARQVFDELQNRDEVSWNTLIAGYVEEGNCRLARQCLEDMKRHSLRPNDMIYSSILAACSHAGDVEEGRHHFELMSKDHGITPSVDHLTCMVELLSRAGHLNEAEELLQIMPMQMDISGWMSLLTACRKHNNVELGRHCFDQVVQRDPNVASGYVIMSNIYADANMWEDAHQILELKKHADARKEPGKAWMEVDNKVHEFIVGNRLHSQSVKFYADLERLRKSIKKKGYVPRSDLVLKPISESANKDFLSDHNFRTHTITFGLLVLSEGMTLRVTQSIITWTHTISPGRIMSRIQRKKIIFSDTFRIDLFDDGMWFHVDTF